MLKNLRFFSKMMIMPALVIIVLVALVFVNQYFNQRNSVLLAQIKTGFVPALEWAYQLEAKLGAFQRTMQDAAAAEDEEELAVGKTLAQEFLELLQDGNRFPLVAPDELEAWHTNFQHYSTRTYDTTLYLIEGGSLTDGIVEQLQTMSDEYNANKAQTLSKIREAKEAVSRSFEATRTNSDLSTGIMSAIILCSAFGLGGFALLLTGSITRPLTEVITVANELARGNAEVAITIDSKDEIGKLAQVFASLIEADRNLANAATAIGNGDYGVPVTVRSADDMLGNALSIMKANLISGAAEIELRDWIKTGLTELNYTLRGEKDTVGLAQEVIGYLARYLNAQIGAICLADDEQTLTMVGSYAYSERKGNRNQIRWGEGLIGQAALEKQQILFSHVPADYIKISSQLGEIAPRSILVTPLLYENAVKGVVELGTVHKFTERDMEFLNQACESIAIALHSAQSRLKLRELLQETQRQSQTLQDQQETLQLTNKELEEQAEALKTSEQQLQTQQEELRQTNEELEEQTHALEGQKKELGKKNADLLEARMQVEQKAKDLELSSRYKSEFFANMSHELRTPLNSLLILAKLLYQNKEGNLTGKQIEFAQTIHTSGLELLELINEVLDLSKVESGKMTLNLEELNMQGLARYVEQHFAHVVAKKGLALKIQVDEDVPASIRTDRQRLEQILKNLLSNAIKFTTEGAIELSIARPSTDANLSQSGLDPRQSVAIAISDSGPGIPADKQQLIFEAFQQVDGTISRKFGGTGLGLSIVREFAQLLGGEIRLKSEPGVGSTFTVYLPETHHDDGQTSQEKKHRQRPVPSSANNVDAPSADLVELHPPPSGGVESIRDDRHEKLFPADRFLLIIEDDPKFAKILFDLARERGFKALLAGDGAAGLQLAYQYTPDAIILDVQLPGIDGWTVMQKLRESVETRHIPVHFVSGMEQTIDVWKLGALGFLSKPATLVQLQEVFLKLERAISTSMKRLLVVEDDETACFTMQELLGGDDVEITMVATGEEAYQLLQEQTFDCMVLDLGLGDVSGFDLLERLHERTEALQLPIIIHTGKDLTKEEEARLHNYAESIVIKGSKAQERLLDEVALFLHRVESELPEEQRQKLRILHEKEMVLDGKRILMVDDDMRNIFALSSVLEEKGLDVIIAENGREALEALNRHADIALVLMDIMMPEMDGYTAMQEIRNLTSEMRNVPIIALTAKAMKGDRKRCIDAGANDYLTKPVDTDKLLSLLRVWLY